MKLKLIGILSIIVGLLYIVFLALPFFFVAIVGWTADRGPESFLDWLTLFFLDRISLGSFYISFLMLFISGIAMVKMKNYSIKLGIITSMALIVSGLVITLCWFVNCLLPIPTHHNSVRIGQAVERLVTGEMLFSFYVPIIYAIFLLIYFKRSIIKRDNLNNK